MKWTRRVIICEICESGWYAWDKLIFNLRNVESWQRKNPSNFGTVRKPRIPDLENTDNTIIRTVNICTSPDRMTFQWQHFTLSICSSILQSIIVRSSLAVFSLMLASNYEMDTPVGSCSLLYYVCVCVCVCVYIYMYVCIYIYIYIYIYMYIAR